MTTMTKLSNRYNYPSAIVRAIENDTYSRGDSEFSATGLIAPARIRVLTEFHKDDIEIDVDDQIFILQGHAMHAVLERAGQCLGHNVEKRYFADFDGTVVSSQIDSLENDILTDWKNTSVFGFTKNKAPKYEYVAQMNIQLEILRRNGLDVKKLQIGAILRDWRPGEAAKDRTYPKKVHIQEIPIKPREATVEYINSRIKAHRDAETNLPQCTSEEHWAWRRCAGYCNVAKFCNQYKIHKGEINVLERKSSNETKESTGESVF